MQTVDVLSGTVTEHIAEVTDSVDGNCTDRLMKCHNGSVFTPAYGEGPIHADPSRYSNLIRFTRSHDVNSNLHAPLELDEELIRHLTLLYNNNEQLRVLLTLMRSDRKKDWLTFIGGYGQCDEPDTTVFTCVNNTCSHNDLLSLDYTDDLFTEDVLGLELSPPRAFVLVLVRNNHTRERAVLRVPTESMSLLDAAYNLILATVRFIRLDSLLPETLSAYRKLLPGAFPTDTHNLLSRPRQRIRPDHGVAAVDVGTHSRTRR